MTRNRSSEKSCSVSLVKNRATPAATDQVPNLVPEAVMKELQTGDTAPYYRVESIEYPAEGDNPVGYKPAIYGEAFFESFLQVMNDRPIPGSKRGHEFASRPKSDFYTVGGKLDKKNDGAGIAHFKLYIPPDGDETSNAGFIRDNRAGIVEFSIEAAVEYSVNQDSQDVTILATKGAERNDAVPVGKMEQTVNAEDQDVVENAEGDTLLSASVRKARALINAGKYDARKRWSYTAAVKRRILGNDDWKNYKSWHLVEHTGAEEDTQSRYGYPYGDGRIVLRSALQAAASRASAQKLPTVSSAASRLIDLINEKENAKSGRSLMDTKEEALEFLRVNHGIPLAEIANAMGQEGAVVTPDHTAALQVVNGLKELGLKDLVVEVKNLQERVKAGETDRIANRLTAEFGPEKSTDGKVNLLRAYAAKQITNAEDLDGQIEAAKKDPVAQQLAGQAADFTSNANKVGIVEQGEKPADDPDAPIVADY